MSAQIEVVSKGNRSLGFGIPKAFLKYGIPLAAVGIAGYLLVKNLPAITSFVGNGLGSIAGSIGTNIQSAIDKFNASINNAVNGGNVQGSPQAGDTVHHLVDNSGKTQVIPAGKTASNPELNLTDPSTGKLINLGDFQNKYPSLYQDLSKLALPVGYEASYSAGQTNLQPAAYIPNVPTQDIYDLNVALGANIDTGEFDVAGKKFYVTGSPIAVALTPYELNYDQSHNIKVIQA